MPTVNTTQPRLYKQYVQEVRPQLKQELKLANLHEVPSLEKIVINVGTGRSAEDARFKETVVTTLRKITGQQPVETIARKSIAGFKLRQGQKIGFKVTLRGDRMYEFMDRLVNIVLPRLRDFHGVSPVSFDEQGNYSIGMKDQSVFPELSFEDTAVIHGLQINFVLSSSNPEISKELLRRLGMPFERTQDEKKENN